jgi:hypothetical protein
MAAAPFVLILGMHRSGTSCLAGALEACGLWLGEVDRSARWNAKGNREHDPARLLNDRILEESGGSWSKPPADVDVTPAHHAAMAGIARELAQRSPAGLKDPRVLLVLDAWTEAIGAPRLVGTYRHPGAVAASLTRRNQLAQEQSHALWLRYNAALVARHRERPFPIVAFDLSEPERYCAAAARVAERLGLRPELARLREFVSAELDHGGAFDAAIPDACRDTWEYLEAVREPWAGAAAEAPAAARATPPSRPRIHLVSGPTCAGKSLYIGRRGEPDATVLLPDKGALPALAAGGRFLVHYDLLRPLAKLAADADAPFARRLRGLGRRLRSTLSSPFAIDRRLGELLAADADFEASVLVVPRDTLLARIASRGSGDDIVRDSDLPGIYRAWLQLLRERHIPYRLIDASDPAYRPIADERDLDALLDRPAS